MARRIPPLNPLHVFEAAARLGSFTKAAEELNVTQSAVSRQVAVLEGYLKLRLFRRERYGITLTPIGKAYRDEIAPAFTRISAATERLLQAGRAEPLRLRCYNIFALKWLIPRLPRFHADYPGIEVKLSTAVALVDFAQEELDLAIQFGDGRWPGLEAQRLIPDILQPICSPKLLRRRQAPKTLEDLRHHRLLHTRFRRNDWREWLNAVGGPDIADTGMEFPGSLMAYQAAAEGLGIAMGQIGLLALDFAAGSLVPLFDRPLERPLAHYAVWPKGRVMDHKLRVFLAWLEQEIERR